MRKGYGLFIIEEINKKKQGDPIFTEAVADLVVKEFGIDIRRAKGIVNTNLNRLNGNLILNYKKGVYYKPKITVFGKAPLNPMKIATEMYLKNNDKIIGYETGASLLQQIGLTTQISRYRYIATNRYHQRGKRVIEDMKLVISKPNTEVTKDNCLYLQFTDAIENKDGIIIDAHNPNEILNEYIIKNQLDYGKLVAIATKNYSKEVLLRIADLAVKTRL